MKKSFIIFSILVFSLNSLSAQKSYEELVQKGMEYADKNDYYAAISLLELAMKNEPANKGNILLMVNLAGMKRNIGELNEALLLYNIATDNHPNNIFIRHNRAALLCEMKDFDKAMVDYNIIILHNEEDYEAYYRRGLLHLESQNILAAEEDFEKVLSIVPEHLKAKMGMALVLKYRQDWEEAEKLYTELIYNYRSDAALYYHRAECYLNMKKLARTQEDLAKARNLNYNAAAVSILQGRLFLAQYDKRMAKNSFLKAKEEGASEELVAELLLLCK